MFAKLLNLLLLLAIGLAVVQHVRLQSTQAELLREHRRLSIQYGILPVEDPSKFYFRRVQEEEKAHFVWRFYVPESQRLMMESTHLSGSGQSSVGYSPDHAIMRVRIGRRDGILRLYCSANGGSSLSSFAYPNELAEFLFENWDQLNVEVSPEDVLESDLTEVVTLLKVTVPEELIPLAVERTPHAESHKVAERLSKPILLVQVGTQEAFATKAAQNQ